MSDTDNILESFKDDVLKVLQDNLVSLLHHGSRARGEARPDSDYDVVIVTKHVNKEVIKGLQNVFSKYPEFSLYLLSLEDLKTIPIALHLQFLNTKSLYGSLEIKAPTNEEVVSYINYLKDETLHTIRHTLIFPHLNERKVKQVYFGLKYVYVCLSYLAFSEKGKLPPTRKQTIAYFKQDKRQSLGIHLLEILEDWNSYKEDVTKNPESYLFLLEEFFRELHI